MVTQYQIGWVVRLRKPHPCGGANWEVVRVGADIGLKCLGCQRRILMPRSALDKRIEAIVSQDNPRATELDYPSRRK